ncbi:hypothetical protein KD913_04450 [Klebsiella pneumoniae]
MRYQLRQSPNAGRILLLGCLPVNALFSKNRSTGEKLSSLSSESPVAQRF